MLTFGTSQKFPAKSPLKSAPPHYGPFKHGDPAHIGHNKTIGGHGRSTEYNYIEEQEQDNVKYQKNVKGPVWLNTAQMSKSMMNSSVAHHFKNANLDKSLMSFKWLYSTYIRCIN